MKHVFYDNWLAKLILWSGYSTIMLYGFILSKLSKDRGNARLENHEGTHQYQFIECMVLGVALFGLITALFGFSGWFVFLAISFFYLMYGGEWIVRIMYNIATGDLSKFDNFMSYIVDANTKAYKAISFEREAKLNENDNDYLGKKRKLFSYKFFKYYIGLKS